jgi:PhnB protein
VGEAARFYRDVLGWTVDDPEDDRPSFDQPDGHISGAWMSSLPVSPTSGLLPYVYVDDVDETVRRITAHGGELLSGPRPEGVLTVATFRDPAGNTLGLWHDTTRPGGGDPDGPPGAIATGIQPQLWVEPAPAAVAFYQAAFGATVLHQVGDGDDIVAQLDVEGAAFWVAPPDPSMSRLDPRAISGATGRTLLVVADPERVVAQAAAAGARVTSAVGDEHGWQLGRITDPFGHAWEIGRPLRPWPPG